ncbi:MAG: VCBS repeat-containing protein [Planctomycetes bacterium]|nr:VCBS repeat-containing protein [Planctomycetota bacterium]
MPARIVLVSLALGNLWSTIALAAPWARHTIDASSRGADGVRIADVNGDGLMDLATGWEEGGVIRAYLNPGPKTSKQPWPAVTVGNVKSPEDAVFADIDGDGAMDVVSSCEGKTRNIFIHWAPNAPANYLKGDAWQTEKIPCADNNQMWMFCLPMQVDWRHGIDLVVSSKGPNASVGWLEAPANPHDLAAWKYHRLYDAGWIMSLIARDMDRDGDQDVLVSDRKGPNRGVLWLENPGNENASDDRPWNTRRLGASDREVMFLAVGNKGSDYHNSVFATCRGNGIAMLSPPEWSLTDIPMPANCGTGKGIAITDVNLDGNSDVIFTCESANGSKSGVRWLSRDEADIWKDHEISGPDGIKFDRIEMLDLDQDGDLDLVTCEERANLGVIWYENPTR